MANYFAAQQARRLAENRLEWRLHLAYKEHTMSNSHVIIDNKGRVSRKRYTLRGAKMLATRCGFTVVGVSSALGYNIDIVCRKVRGRWMHSTHCT